MVLMAVQCAKINSNIRYQISYIEDWSLVKVAHLSAQRDIHSTFYLDSLEIFVQHCDFIRRFTKVKVDSKVNREEKEVTEHHWLHDVSQSFLDVLIQEGAIATSNQFLEMSSHSKLVVQDKNNCCCEPESNHHAKDDLVKRIGPKNKTPSKHQRDPNDGKDNAIGLALAYD